MRRRQALQKDNVEILIRERARARLHNLVHLLTLFHFLDHYHILLNTKAAMSSSPTTAPAGSEPSNARRIAFLRTASTPTLERADAAPVLTHRWLHASETGKAWTPFGQRDSHALDEAWKLDSCKEERKKWLEEHGDATTDKKGKGELAYSIPPPDPAEELPAWRVPVAEDRLYEVDLRALKLSPVFWKGKPTEVLRGRWFFDASKLTPCNDELADEIEKLYA